MKKQISILTYLGVWWRAACWCGLVVGLMFAGRAAIAKNAKAAYIVNAASQGISILDIEKWQITNHVISVGKWPADIKIQGNFAYVVNTGDNNVQIIDLNNNTTAGIIDIGNDTWPEKIAFASDSKAYVTSNRTNSVKVVDLASRTVQKSIEVGVEPFGTAFINGKIYVCNSAISYVLERVTGDYGEGTVSVIDTATDRVISTIKVEINPVDVVSDSKGNVLVLCNGNYSNITGKLVVIDSSTDNVTATIDLGTIPSGIAVSPKGIAYITCWGGLLAYDITTGKLLHDASAPLSDFAEGAGLAADNDGNLYITVPDWIASDRDKLLVMDASEKLVRTYTPGRGASMVAIRQEVGSKIMPPQKLTPWDVNGDGKVDVGDLVLVGRHFGEIIKEPISPNPDVNGDGTVDISDLVLIGKHFGGSAETLPLDEEINHFVGHWVTC